MQFVVPFVIMAYAYTRVGKFIVNSLNNISYFTLITGKNFK